MENYINNYSFLFGFFTCTTIAFYISPPLFPLLVPPFFQFPLSFTFSPPEVPPSLRSHSLWSCIAFAQGHRKTAENLCRYNRPFKSLSPVYILWKKDLPLSVSICRPRTGGHPSKYWPSAKQIDLCDCLVSDTYHAPNVVGNNNNYFFIFPLFQRILCPNFPPIIPYLVSSDSLRKGRDKVVYNPRLLFDWWIAL